MAEGLRTRIDIEDAEVRAALAGLEGAARDMTPAFDEIGGYIVARTVERIETATGPGGVAWPPLSPATLARRGADARPLQDTGRLRDSHTWIAGPDSLLFGTNVVYAAIQQLGGQAGRGLSATIPARPFLGVDDVDRREIADILGDHIREGFAP